MFEGFEYVSKFGILLKEDYRPYNSHKNKCQYHERDIIKKSHLSNIGYIEHDGRTNEELKVLL